ncbi:MAG: sulfotransferase, partial [Anaerolineales bacterium]|nr:sulfotransferase [Anaerolineales bacterium]
TDSNAQPILVTGAHRSGTTWVGKMLAGSQVAYISEPLNVLHRPGVLRAKVKHWYQYICDENESEFLAAFKELLDYRYHTWSEIKSIRSLKDFLRMGRDFKIFYDALEHGQRALLKDPFAVFSIPWFVKRFDFNVVVTVRHPAAFANSLKRLGWNFNFNDLLDQPLLMRDHLESFCGQMQAVKADDVIGQASLLWTMIYKTVHSQGQLDQRLVIVRHEDLSHDPVSGFRDLYAALGLDFTHHAEERILNSSSSDNPTELSRRKTHSVKMDSRASMNNWKTKLTPDEIQRIRDITEETARLFYPDINW